jgi:hypothetical protein
MGLARAIDLHTAETRLGMKCVHAVTLTQLQTITRATQGNVKAPYAWNYSLSA